MKMTKKVNYVFINSFIEIKKIDSLSKVQSYFEDEYRKKQLVVNFKSMDQLDQDAIQEYRESQKYKALDLMKKLNTKFLA